MCAQPFMLRAVNTALAASALKAVLVVAFLVYAAAGHGLNATSHPSGHSRPQLILLRKFSFLLGCL